MLNVWSRTAMAEKKRDDNERYFKNGGNTTRLYLFQSNKKGSNTELLLQEILNELIQVEKEKKR